MTATIQQLDDQVIEGFDFILSHLDLDKISSKFPRTISTKTTDNRQILIANKQEALARFKQSNYLDCRINAYSDAGGSTSASTNGPVNFLFIDLDRLNLLDLDKALESTKINILHRLNGGYPTVLWTGNGYHIYQPLQDFYFSDVSHFNKFESVNKKFLRYAAAFLSNNNSDKNNYQSAKSCMLRIPGTLNSKCLDNNRDPQVKIIQKWNGIRSSITGLLANFYAYMTDEKIKEDNYEQKFRNISKFCTAPATNSIEWIDLLLKTPIADYRKNAISLILAPYLITKRQLQPVEATNQIKDWLEECSKLRRLDFNANYRISAAINNIQRNQIRPMRLDTLKARNPELYDLLIQTN